MLFFLEARAAFLITLFLYFIRFTPLYLITGLSFLTVIYSFIIDINPYSIAKGLANGQIFYQILTTYLCLVLGQLIMPI